ncbi:VOC family protein [Simplicispira suum]|nr:VOC family protein [Simplicispira suum]
MTFRVTDIQRAKALYSEALAPLGCSVSFDGRYGMNILGVAYSDSTESDGTAADMRIIDGPSPYGGPPATTGCHLAWKAQTHTPVDAFHAAALSAAGKDNSAPSLRPDDHPHCYGAFVIDMEGNNMGAVCHRPEQAAHRNSVSSDGRIYIRIA